MLTMSDMSFKSRNLLIMLLMVGMASTLFAKDYDYNKIQSRANKYLVEITIQTEVSFGTQTTEVESRGMGTIVTSDGMVVFDGRPIDSEDPFSTMTGMQINAEPVSIDIKFFDGRSYKAEYIGIDRFTKIGFARISGEENEKFDYLDFNSKRNLKIGDMLICMMLLPDYVEPPMSIDIGMVSALLTEPEEFILTVGFNELELVSPLFDSTGTAVGILGHMTNPNLANISSGQLMDPFSNLNDYVPLLGVISSDKIQKLIKDPPKPGKVSRGWMGIYLQALTTDIAEFWGIKAAGGIIVNEVVKNSPADSAGLKTGDIIVKLDGEDIKVDKEENLAIFQRDISELGAEAEVSFEILRRDSGIVETLAVSIVLVSAPITPSEADDYEDDNFELKVRDMVFADYNIYNLDSEEFNGIVVKEVESGGWASIGNLYPGDIVQSIDGEEVESVEQAELVFERLAEDKPKEVIFFVWRDNKTLFINLKTDW